VLAEAIMLLKKAREELGNHWFYYADEGMDEYNNDEVIALSEEIDEFLNKLKEVDNAAT